MALISGPQIVRLHCHSTYFFIISLFFFASAALTPPMSAQVPLATYFHSSAPFASFDWPAQECVPDRLAQSFLPASATP